VDAHAAVAYDAPTAVCDAWLVEGLAAAVARRGYPTLRLSSGPNHDVTSFSRRIPFAMLFVRCRGWVSYDRTAYASPDDLGAASDVLADFAEHFVPVRLPNVRRED
jgi:allantoate deiminase